MRALLLLLLCEPVQAEEPPDLELPRLMLDDEPMATVQAVEAQATAWLASLGGKPFSLTIRSDGYGLASYRHYYVSPPSTAPAQDDSLFIYRDRIDGAFVSIRVGFKTDISPTSTLQEVQQRLSWVGLDALPVPALVAEGWRISPSTSPSSLSREVKVTGFDGQHLQLEIDASFYDVFGHATTRWCEPMMDTPSLPACVFSVRQPFEGHILSDLPIFSAAPEP